MGIELIRAIESDAEALFAMQVEAFRPLLERYQDYDTNPASETIDRVIARINDPSGVFYKIMEHEVLIGAVRVYSRESAQFWISPIFVSPLHQGRGIAQRALLAVEQLYPHAMSWELATIREERQNCYLYEKMGFVLTGAEKPLNDRATLVFYKKTCSL